MISITYVLYRIFREIIMILMIPFYQRIKSCHKVGLLRIESASIDDYSCEIFNILTRMKAYVNPGDVARDVDFILWPERCDPMETLLNPHWTLYALSSEWVYFCYTEKTMANMQAREIPFMHQTQFNEAQKIARITVSDFGKFELLCGLPKPKICYISNVPRAGTTLFTTMIQASEKIIAISEPNIFTSLSTYKETCVFSTDLFHSLIRGVLSKLCLEFNDPGSVVMLKPQSNGGIIAGEIQTALPPGSVKHIFLYRREVVKVMSSIEKMLNASNMLSDYVALVNSSRTVANQLIGFSRFMPLLQTHYPVHDTLAVAGLFFLGPFSWFSSQQGKGVKFHVICFENLVEDPRGVMSKVLEHVGIFNEDTDETQRKAIIDASISAMTQDSQAGTSLSQDKLKHVKASLLTAERRIEFDIICSSMGLPPMFVSGRVPDLY